MHEVTIRPWTLSDAGALQRLADDASVSRYMTRDFPCPYTAQDARSWLGEAARDEPPQMYAILADGEIAGGGGVEPHNETHSGVAITGYWLGKAYWGRGIATAALRLLVDVGRERGYRRMQANVFAPNAASSRVLEKCGFTLEGRLRQSYMQRDGVPCDELIYGLVF